MGERANTEQSNTDRDRAIEDLAWDAERLGLRDAADYLRKRFGNKYERALEAAAKAVVEAQQRFIEAPEGAWSLYTSHRLSEKIERLREALEAQDD